VVLYQLSHVRTCSSIILGARSETFNRLLGASTRTHR
jgi:hypothetical protein